MTGWALQTLWNREVAILLVPGDSLPYHTSSRCGVHRLYIRCDSEIVLKSLLADVERVIYAISGGFLALTYDEDCLDFTDNA